MIYNKKVNIPSTSKLIEHKVAKCIKCGNDDINIQEYEDQYGFISIVSCKKTNCKNEVRLNASEVCAIKEWNKKNDIKTVIADKEKLITKTKLEIIKLKKIKQ